MELKVVEHQSSLGRKTNSIFFYYILPVKLSRNLIHNKYVAYIWEYLTHAWCNPKQVFFQATLIIFI